MLILSYLFIVMFVIINLSYLLITLLSIVQLNKSIRGKFNKLIKKPSNSYQPISILIPAFNEEKCILHTIKSVINQNYSNYEIIIINDGSTDNTFQVLNNFLKLSKSNIKNYNFFKTAKVKNYFQSLNYPSIKVIDKINGGKADSLNCGLNISKYDIYCSLDSDTLLNESSLFNIMHPFETNKTVIASGGEIRIVNGCYINNGKIIKIKPPKNILALTQCCEYSYSFIFGRIGWLTLKCPLILSGAFSAYCKKYIIKIGGYSKVTIGEDMEIILRLHSYMKKKKIPYNITHVPEAIGWSQAPQDFSTLKYQRYRWHLGMGESLFLHKSIFLNKSMGVIGYVAFPFALFIQFLSPIPQLIAYIFFITSYSFGFISSSIFFAFIFFSIILGTFISLISLILDHYIFKIWQKKKYLFILFLGAIIENCGYRQLNLLWRFIAIFKFLINSKYKWGEMKRISTFN